MEKSVRSARRTDMQRICEIYNHYIEETPATFELVPHSVDMWNQVFDEVIAPGKHLLLVAEVDDELIGFAKTSDFHERAGYASSVQVSVFCDPASTGSGAGRALYNELLPMLEGRWHRVYGGVALPNPASIALHERFGFERCAMYHEVGFKFDRYWDVAWYEKVLG